MQLILQIINNTGRMIDVIINNRPINVNETFSIELVNTEVSIGVTTHNISSSITDDNKCLIETNITFDLSYDDDLVLLTLWMCVRQYQNNTQYCYFIPRCIGGKILNMKYCVSDNNGVEEYVNRHMTSKKTNRILSILGWCIFDTILDGGLLGLILWFVFNVKIALLCMCIVFVVELMVRILCRTLDKSRHRFLNWAKEADSFDDVGYLIKHIQKFCK